MGAQRPPGLKFERELWLDEDGRGLTWRDRLSGSGQNTWRLDASPGQQLGSVKIDGEGQLITRHPANKTEGVEVRRRDLNLTATGRSAFAGSLSATGWQANAESLDVSLHLPPGWRLIAAFGPEWSQGDWLTSWSLLDVFMVLILGLAVHRLHGWKTAILAVLALVLLWKEPNAPRWSWGILVTVAALRLVVPHYPKLKFLLCGTGPIRNDFLKKRDALGLTDNIEVPGWMDQPSLLSQYQRAHLFLHPSELTDTSDQEGIPNSMLEAMATGLPVIATHHGGIPEAVTHGLDGLLVPERSPQQLAEAILTLLGDPALLTRLSTAAPQTVRARFGLEASISRLEDCYDEALTGKSRETGN
jgi:hypothetical protein